MIDVVRLCFVTQDDELLPSKLERCTDPLEQAIRFLVPLQTLCADQIQSHIFAYEIYSRKEKPLLMLKAIKGGYALKTNDPQFHVCLVKFLNYVKSRGSSLPESVRQVLDKEMIPIYGKQTPQEMNMEFLTCNTDSVPHRLAAAQALYYLDENTQNKALPLACSTDSSLKGINITNCTEVFESLSRGDLGPCTEQLEQYKQTCQRLFPHASIFSPPPSEGPADAPATNGLDSQSGAESKSNDNACKHEQ